jgi:hypothetical protein
MREARPVTTVRLRLGDALVCFVAIVAFLVAALQLPLRTAFSSTATPMMGTRRGGEENPLVVVKSVELARVAAARPSRGEAPRPTREDGPLRTLSVIPATFTVAMGRPLEPWQAPPGVWAPRAKARAELMVFLN